jgi:DNA-binding LacI/PurR family transcriptional regulator
MLTVEVAKLAGVSNTTVSRVMNRIGTVKPDTIERAGKSMARAGYTPKPFSSRSGPRLSSYLNGNGRHSKQTDLIALLMCMKPSFPGLSPVLSSASALLLVINRVEFD